MRRPLPLYVVDLLTDLGRDLSCFPGAQALSVTFEQLGPWDHRATVYAVASVGAHEVAGKLEVTIFDQVSRPPCTYAVHMDVAA